MTPRQALLDSLQAVDTYESVIVLAFVKDTDEPEAFNLEISHSDMTIPDMLVAAKYLDRFSTDLLFGAE